MNRRDWITATTGTLVALIVPRPERDLPRIETNIEALKQYHGEAVSITYANGLTVRGILDWRG